MYGRNMMENIHIVPAVWPVDLNTGANPGDYVNLKNYPLGLVHITCTTATGTAVVTLKQAKTVAGGSEKALSFSEYWMTGCKLKIKTKTGTFSKGETLTGGTSGAVGYVYKDYGTHVVLYTVNATAFQDGETVTGGTTGYTAKADGVKYDEDIMVPVSCTDTFTIPAVANRCYAIPFDASMLDCDGEFDCARVHIAQADAAKIGSVVYILDPSSKQRIQLSAIYD